MNSERVLRKSRSVDAWIFPPAMPAEWLRLVGAAAGMFLRTCVARFRQRDELKELDSRMLRDIGVTEEQARRESSKTFWVE